MSGRITSWTARHVQALLASSGRLSRAPLATGLTVLVMALALALPLGLLTLVQNVRTATGDFSGAVSLSVYLKQGVAVAKAEQLARAARARPDVARVELITADAALAQFRSTSGFGAALDALEENPLPHVLGIAPSAAASTPAAVEALRRFLTAWPEVETVQLDTEWVTRFNAILAILRRVLLVAACLLGAGVVAIVGNTIRLEIQNRRAEIEVTKLVGGTNAFVRRPFLYAGVLYGLIAGLLSWLIVSLALRALSGPAGELARAYGSRFELAGPTPRELLWLLLAGLALGWAGSWLAAARHLRSIEPSI
jgi:cell division transport system permease protein